MSRQDEMVMKHRNEGERVLLVKKKIDKMLLQNGLSLKTTLKVKSKFLLFFIRPLVNSQKIYTEIMITKNTDGVS